ncbi:maleylpyruvate isomerase family mycothiol-dependent enzyme [Saccharothrix sp. NPDC042600]|uniref:maleylpyruvate isomerase family mycothiol-dependent enzyme n=1 Tax=Saccharothrix TaxID=2071 RepID=UPI0033EDB986|nr:maleylpyruvate isomerase family mycothiol-dependent enzyme [Saccharothrix mutabilis subsp. capreolus]
MAFALERYCAEIVTQTDLLRAHVTGADMRTRVPSCPDWNLGQLLRHVGGGHRWIEQVIQTGGPVPNPARDLDGYTDEDAAYLDGWLAESATVLTKALRDNGPDRPVEVGIPGFTSPELWARRMTHETAVHRADAAAAVGAEFDLAPEIAADAVDEWMVFGASPRRGVAVGPGRSLRFEATDTDAAWFVDLTGEAPQWRRGREDAAVTVRGPVAELVLSLYLRPAPHVEVTGDRALLEDWVARTGIFRG